MKIAFLLSLLFPLFVHALEVDIVSSFNIEELPTQLETVRKSFQVNRVCPSDYFVRRAPYDPDLVKIIVFDPFLNRDIIPKLPKKKVILFLWEPAIHSAEFYRAYSKVYTWDDTLIDNVKFFRFNYPYLMPFQEGSLSVEEKKLCTMVVGNWTAARLNVVKFFETYHLEGLDCYGRCPPGLTSLNMWKGAIMGSHSGQEKISTLQQYRFCFCFENTIGLKGYITEKIFSCFAAGCIPIYWGADNIEEYIPKTCFIDYRDFTSIEELYQFISTLSHEEHDRYLQEIQKYLQSEQAYQFSPEAFDALLYEAITRHVLLPTISRSLGVAK